MLKCVKIVLNCCSIVLKCASLPGYRFTISSEQDPILERNSKTLKAGVNWIGWCRKHKRKYCEAPQRVAFKSDTDLVLSSCGSEKVCFWWWHQWEKTFVTDRPDLRESDCTGGVAVWKISSFLCDSDKSKGPPVFYLFWQSLSVRIIHDYMLQVWILMMSRAW